MPGCDDDESNLQSARPRDKPRPILLLAVWGVMTLAAVAFVFTCAQTPRPRTNGDSLASCSGKSPRDRGSGPSTTCTACPWRDFSTTQFRLTHDFRAGMLLQIAMVSALCLGLMRLAANLRGRHDWADLFFPISLLHVGHWENYLLGYQIRFTLFLVFASGLVAVALRTRREIRVSFRCPWRRSPHPHGPHGLGRSGARPSGCGVAYLHGGDRREMRAERRRPSSAAWPSPA